MPRCFSRTYVDRVLEGLQDVRLGTPIVSVKRPDSKDIQGKVQLTDAHGHVEEFDHVIFATHTDQALKILGNDATQKEKEILGAIKYVKNRAVLHRDTSLMPRIRKTWSSWNYLTQSKMESRSQQMCLSYWMNNLQPFIKEEKFGTVIVTLNPVVEPNPDLVMQEFEYEHPLYCPEVSLSLFYFIYVLNQQKKTKWQTISAQDALNEIQNKNRTLFAGAWTNYGFHEDGCTSGLLAALSLGARLPFPVLLNGGYPTTRTPPSPPEYLMERKEVPVKPYVAPPPTRLSHAQDDDNTPMSLWTSLAAIAGVSSVVLWKLLY
jgi:predicted NAD/FAD-binding protein